MKDKSKDPYNFEKTADFIREYNLKTNGKNQSDGKIYMKKQKNSEQNKGHGE